MSFSFVSVGVLNPVFACPSMRPHRLSSVLVVVVIAVLDVVPVVLIR